MYFAYNSSVLAINRVVFDFILKFIHICEECTFLARSDCSSISNQINTKHCSMVKSLNTYPSMNSFFYRTDHCGLARRTFRNPFRYNSSTATAMSLNSYNCIYIHASRNWFSIALNESIASPHTVFKRFTRYSIN